MLEQIIAQHFIDSFKFDQRYAWISWCRGERLSWIL